MKIVFLKANNWTELVFSILAYVLITMIVLLSEVMNSELSQFGG